MARRTPKWLVAALSGSIAAAVGLYALRILREKPMVEMRRVDPSDVEALRASLHPQTPRAGGAASAALRVRTLDLVAGPFPPSTLRRTPLSAEQFAHLRQDQDDPRVEYDPFCYVRYKADLDYEWPMPDTGGGTWRFRTNNLGLREDDDVRRDRPDLRILVTGDSHTDGVCQNSDSFTNVLERALASDRPTAVIEALNGGRGNFSFFNYLGVLERFLPLCPDVFIVGAYGGNDFQELLAMQHVFQGTSRSAKDYRYWPLVEQAGPILPAAISQSFVALKNFTMNEHEVEVALQAARDVSSEIAATCRRFGVQPIFVYIPPLPDVEWDRHSEPLEKLRNALEMTREETRITDRMADSWIAFLRWSKLDVLDMRPAFRASPHELYWMVDHHINVEAHRLIAEGLKPLVDAARPAGVGRVEPCEALADEAEHALMSPGAASRASTTPVTSARPRTAAPEEWRVILSDAPLSVPALDATAVRNLFDLGPHAEFDARTWIRWRPSLDVEIALAEHPDGGWRLRTNSAGVRSNVGFDGRRPSRAVLVVGDADFMSACEAERTTPGLLAARLRDQGADAVDVIDAGAPGWTLWQDLGVLDRFAALAPEAVVATVHGGTDFYSTLRIARELGRGLPASTERARRATLPALPSDRTEAILAQFEWFQRDPSEIAPALHAATAVMVELENRCRAAGIELIVLYVPPVTDVEWIDVQRKFAPMLDSRSAGQHDTDAMATAFIDELRRREILVVDTRQPLRNHPRACYWRTNHSLNPEGHRVVASSIHEDVATAIAIASAGR